MEDFSEQELNVLVDFERHSPNLSVLSAPLSQRRKLNALRVARSFANLDGKDSIEMQHLRESFAVAVFPFLDLMNL